MKQVSYNCIKDYQIKKEQMNELRNIKQQKSGLSNYKNEKIT